jgi:hypothetical protein
VPSIGAIRKPDIAGVIAIYRWVEFRVLAARLALFTSLLDSAKFRINITYRSVDTTVRVNRAQRWLRNKSKAKKIMRRGSR